MRSYMPQMECELDYIVFSKEKHISHLDSIKTEFSIPPLLIHSDSAWKKLNSIGATPRFYIIKDGTIIFEETGSNSVHVIEKMPSLN